MQRGYLNADDDRHAIVNRRSWKTESRFNRLRQHRYDLLQNLWFKHIEALYLLHLLHDPASLTVPRSFATDFLVARLRAYHSYGLLVNRHCRGSEVFGRLDSAFRRFQPAARMLALQWISQLISYCLDTERCTCEEVLISKATLTFLLCPWSSSVVITGLFEFILMYVNDSDKSLWRITQLVTSRSRLSLNVGQGSSKQDLHRPEVAVPRVCPLILLFILLLNYPKVCWISHFIQEKIRWKKR